METPVPSRSAEDLIGNKLGDGSERCRWRDCGSYLVAVALPSRDHWKKLLLRLVLRGKCSLSHLVLLRLIYQAQRKVSREDAAHERSHSDDL